MKLTDHSYGKTHVRVLKVTRDGTKHSIKELDVQVMLHGDFDASYTKADNSLVVATDSMKNTVNVLAKEKLGTETEPFGIALAEHFIQNYAHVDRAEVRLSERGWERLSIAGRPHPHSFTERGTARPTASIVSTRSGTWVESGIEDLLILKSTASGFEDFLRDKFTTLPETSDRVFATKLKAVWTFEKKPVSYATANRNILEAMLKAFAENFSPSVQVTLFQMGEAALQAAPEVKKVHLAMPNKHCLLINLAPFGLENKNELFVPTDEPTGKSKAPSNASRSPPRARRLLRLIVDGLKFYQLGAARRACRISTLRSIAFPFGPDSHGAQADWFEAQSYRGRIRLETEIILRGIRKHRIGED
jgi:urate oxidase